MKTNVQLSLEILEMLSSKQFDALRELLQELQPYDISVIYTEIPELIRPSFLSMLDAVQLTEMIQELGKSDQYTVFRLLGPEKTAEIMDKMDNDDLVHFLDELSEEEKNRFLSTMHIDESSIVRVLMDYPAETAGRIMNNRYVWIPQHYSVSEAVEKIRVFAEISGSISYLYVIDGDKKLIGVVSYRDLILANPGDKVSEIMFTRVIYANVSMDQEEVAQIIRNYDFLAVPVVDHNHVLRGIITVDDIIDIVIQEADEDIQKLSGGGKDIDFDTTPIVAASRRLPWLVLLLLIGLVSGTIISRFEETLDRIVALAFFMPMIAGMTGNTGTQSLAVVVRGLISRNLDAPTVIRLLRRELLVGLIIGAVCGLLVTLIAYLWQGNVYLGLVVGLSLIVTLVIGTMAGTVIPLILYRLKVDPAIASGPLITTLNDVLSLFIYFGIATMFISYL
ncbi:magnesium transporter [Paenibacillaceae bacterium]|nr:magnesium transporter [Paenibacillaceae bacterium]